MEILEGLFKGVKRGDIQHVRKLFGADFLSGAVPIDVELIQAASNGDVARAQYLVRECGAYVNASDQHLPTALIKAASGGHIDVVRYLVGECWADVDMKSWADGDTALIKAAASGHVDVVRCLAEFGADVNAADNNGDTALLKAACKGHIHVVRCLAGEFDADVNATASNGDNVLLKAVAEGHVEVVRYLAEELRVDVNAANKWGAALLWAAHFDHCGVVRCLAREFGADVNATDILGTTALIKAAAGGYIDVVQCLVRECGADVNAANNRGTTPLIKASAVGHFGIARYFVEECGADVTRTDKDGCTAIQLAVENGHQDIQRFLTRFLHVKQSKNPVTATANVSFIDDIPSGLIPPSEIELINFVETGNVGGEYRAKWLDADVAVKLFLPDASSSTTFADEVHLWYQMRHPNVIKMYGACSASPLPLQFFVCEYTSINNGSLLEYLKAAPSTEQRVWSLLHQAALGLEYLHERGIIHGDLRCSNILIGSDGLSKLTNFGRSYSLQTIGLGAIPSRVGSVRWQSPEVLAGKAPSLTSDVYSFGICILEALTLEMPWKNWNTDIISSIKKVWTPEPGEDSIFDPHCPPGEARNLVWRMCSQDPARRVCLSSVLRELERLSIKVNSPQLDNDPESTFDDYQYGELGVVWVDVKMRMKKSDSDLYRHAFAEMMEIQTCLQNSTHSSTVFAQFYSLLHNFRQMISMASGQARVLQLSATRAPTSSIVAFRRRLHTLWTALGESADGTREREVRWETQRSEQIEIFVSETSKTYLLLEELKSQEERAAFLVSLKEEIEHPSMYTPGQLELLKKAYANIANKLETDDLAELAPTWFLPWYKLVVDEYNQIGSGGFGSVFRAKWMDSDVVVKHLFGAGDEIGSASTSLYASRRRPPTTPAGKATKRAEILATFQHEVDIWFGFNHPHVVRLFGACHVGRPFFVCEYATNGTLVNYLRKHPDKLWTKLHEASLGVQYLHARGVVHGDLKGNNIVVGSDEKAKVTDFGLSSFASSETTPPVSSALHWVAPECFPQEHHKPRPTFESDIYSLGMCIVEALRVVEAGLEKNKLCYPWGDFANNVVKFHVKQRKMLPARSTICTDDQWQLVGRMCTFNPKKRIKISTVVDELARLTNDQENNGPEIVTVSGVSGESVLKVVSAAFELLKQLQEIDQQNGNHVALYALYKSLWDRLEQVHHQIYDKINLADQQNFCLLVGEADLSTKKLKNATISLVSLTEMSMRCYALRRRLHKFVEANFL